MGNSFKNRKEEEDFEFNFNRYFGALLNIVALIIIISIITFFFKNYDRNSENNPKTENEKISTIDTLNLQLKINLKDEKSILSLNSTLNTQINKLNKLKANIEKSDDVKKDDIKFYFSLIGFMLAIVGFFGFKSIHDSKEIAIKNAIDEAKTASKSILTDETNKIISNKLQEFQIKLDEVGQNYLDLKDSLNKIYELETLISDLKIRLDTLENISTNNVDFVGVSSPDPSSKESDNGHNENYDDDFNGRDEFL